jgi:hypothetical protein
MRLVEDTRERAVGVEVLAALSRFFIKREGAMA